MINPLFKSRKDPTGEISLYNYFNIQTFKHEQGGYTNAAQCNSLDSIERYLREWLQQHDYTLTVRRELCHQE